MILVNGGAEEKKESPKTDTHTVVSGDTLSEIVYNYNKENGTKLTVNEVAKNSGISDPDKIYPGQEIKLGASNSTNSGSSSQGNNPASAQTGGGKPRQLFGFKFNECQSRQFSVLQFLFFKYSTQCRFEEKFPN